MKTHKSNNRIELFRKVQIVALGLLLAFICIVIYEMMENPDFATADSIVNIVPDNMVLAVLFFVMLYIMKGLSFIFPSAVINIAVGIVYELPIALAVSSIGILFEFVSLFLLGKFFSNNSDISQRRSNLIRKIEQLNINNGILLSFFLRITGIISYDFGSLYLGIVGVKFGEFIVGSMIGALINIVLDCYLGRYIFNPTCWQFWIIVIFRVFLMLGAYIVHMVCNREKFDNQKG